jgi:hypothetical protein
MWGTFSFFCQKKLWREGRKGLIKTLISVTKYIGSIAILFLIKEIHFIAFVFASIVLTRNF